ncbi:hypothetical protein C2845_PM10G15380 [Panicum miliaceum]|uniref:Uncharacterized protein n=1 Tax=Panicum miliaceum TaxID=4540 RepID=A0A3L6PEB2_PANMI|nr:hypothetical protein C2845_PM10G15380 [Panicum miliaceum]
MISTHRDMFIQKRRDLVWKNGIARAATDCQRRSTSCAVRLRASCGVRPSIRGSRLHGRCYQHPPPLRPLLWPRSLLRRVLGGGARFARIPKALLPGSAARRRCSSESGEVAVICRESAPHVSYLRWTGSGAAGEAACPSRAGRRRGGASGATAAAPGAPGTRSAPSAAGASGYAQRRRRRRRQGRRRGCARDS